MTVSQSALVFHELDNQGVLVRYSVEYLLIWAYFLDVFLTIRLGLCFFVIGHQGSHHHRQRPRSLCGQGSVPQVSPLQKLPLFPLSSFYSLEASHLA